MDALGRDDVHVDSPLREHDLVEVPGERLPIGKAGRQDGDGLSPRILVRSVKSTTSFRILPCPGACPSEGRRANNFSTSSSTFSIDGAEGFSLRSPGLSFSVDIEASFAAFAEKRRNRAKKGWFVRVWVGGAIAVGIFASRRRPDPRSKGSAPCHRLTPLSSFGRRPRTSCGGRESASGLPPAAIASHRTSTPRLEAVTAADLLCRVLDVLGTPGDTRAEKVGLKKTCGRLLEKLRLLRVGPPATHFPPGDSTPVTTGGIVPED